MNMMYKMNKYWESPTKIVLELLGGDHNGREGGHVPICHPFCRLLDEFIHIGRAKYICFSEQCNYWIGWGFSLFGTKQLPDPVLTYYCLDPSKHG